jgi:hypothetical protein
VDFSVAANAGTISRAAILNIAAQSFSVIQAGTGGAGVTGIFYPRLLNTQAGATNPDEIEFTGVAVANLSGANATLTFTAFDASGSLIAGPGITNPASLELKAGEQIPVIDYQLFGAGLMDREIPGWFKVESASSPVVGFYLIFNQTLTLLDGTDASSRTAAAFILPEIEDAGITQIHVANPNMAPATLTFELVDGNGTLKATPAFRNLNANGFVAESVGELFPGVVPGSSDYLRVSATQNVVPLELLRKTGHYIQALNGQDALEGATKLYSPQYAVGGGAWNTALSVINLDSTPGLVTFRLFGNDGTPSGNPQVLSIAARGKLHITNQKFFLDPGGTLTQGFV